MQPKNSNPLLQKAAKEMGISPQQLEQAVAQNHPEEILEQLTPEQAQSVRRVLQDQQTAQKILQTPEAQALLRKLQQP